MNNQSPDLVEVNKKDDQVVEEKILVVKKERCPQNHPCPSVGVCPVEALSQVGFDAPVVDMDKCIKCGKCVKSCPMGALQLE
ncbi:MAG: 4Fe-4S binding protein [Acetobacterium sp.]|nr:4Fe-4S binding protein [Bacillota bacterium]MCG2731192.1 4Fe-4S binding protein [Acetobacterium sp.]